jgi:regulator of protease activity HflC (stomatin/prohibitin superfamily)
MRKSSAGQAGLLAGFILVVMAVVALLIISSFRTVDTGHIGILTSFGKVTGDELQPGLHNINPLTEGITQMSVQVQKDVADAESASSDLQQTQTQVAVNYHLDPAYVFDLYRNVGVNYADVLIDPAIQESIKATTAQYTAVQLVQRRAVAKAALEQALRARLAVYHIIVDNVNLTNFQFSDAFNKAIEAKQVASQQVLTEQQKLDALKISAQRQVVEAENQARAQVASANGDAQSNIIRAKASAQAQRLQQASLTPLFVQYQAILRWNGALPAYNGGNGPIPFVTVPITR